MWKKFDSELVESGGDSQRESGVGFCKDAFIRQGKALKTKEQVSLEFRQDLQALLAKYGAETELEASDHWTGYAECGQDVRMVVYIPGLYDDNHDCVREPTEVDLGDRVLVSHG